MEFKIRKSNGKVCFRITNSSSNYSFSNPKNMGKTTKSFLRYVMNCQLLDVKPTKRGYYKYIGKPLTRGNLSTFFRSITERGIVEKHSEWNGSFNETWYSIGENFHHYLNGNLERVYTPHWNSI